MKIDGLSFVFEELHRMRHGRCAACDRALPPEAGRTRTFTCDDGCHRLWVDRLVAQVGETKILTLAETGKRYAVPTRVILEHGITADALVTFPEVP